MYRIDETIILRWILEKLGYEMVDYIELTHEGFNTTL